MGKRILYTLWLLTLLGLKTLGVVLIFPFLIVIYLILSVVNPVIIALGETWKKTEKKEKEDIR